MNFGNAVPGRATPGQATPAATAGTSTATPATATKTQTATARIRNTAMRTQTAVANIKGVAGTINAFLFFSPAPAPPAPCVDVFITDLNHLPVRQDTRATWAADDNGAICTLTISDDVVTACAVGIGVANVTVTTFEEGMTVTGTLTVNVFLASGHLLAAWESGTIILNT